VLPDFGNSNSDLPDLICQSIQFIQLTPYVIRNHLAPPADFETYQFVLKISNTI
jgi:hypothetical protein